MNKGFWGKLDKPIFVLAPMADVTDATFRRIIAKYGKPDVMWTEFVSADGLFLGGEKARKILIKDLEFTEVERPIVAQFFTSSTERMEKASRLAMELGFDGIDINMGCPDKSIEKQGAGAALIKNPDLAVQLIKSAKKGAGDLPVSVKTRIGYNKIELEEWLPKLLSSEPAVVTIHARTRKEMSKVPAHWDQVKRAVEIRDELGISTLIIGNGDTKDLSDAEQQARDTGADGIMLGRAIFGNPWLFADLARARRDRQTEHPPKPTAKADNVHITVKECLEILVEHTKLFDGLLPHKNFSIMKKHYKAYVTGWNGAKELRVKLMETHNADEVESIIADYLKG